MMFGLPKDASITDLVKAARKAYASRVPPVTVKTGPVKENIIKGDDINLFDFPVPQWHRLDGGRYINTMQGSVTRDPVSGRMNVGIYRGMIGKKNTIPVLLWRPQNWGQDMQKYADKKARRCRSPSSTAGSRACRSARPRRSRPTSPSMT